MLIVPKISLNSDGRAILVFAGELDENGVKTLKTVASSDFGVNWSSPVQIAASDIDKFKPWIVLENSGKALIFENHGTCEKLVGTQKFRANIKNPEKNVKHQKKMNITKMETGHFKNSAPPPK